MWNRLIKAQISCILEEDDRIMVGRTIMLPELRWGGRKGVKSRTFINTTLGSMHLIKPVVFFFLSVC